METAWRSRLDALMAGKVDAMTEEHRSDLLAQQRFLRERLKSIPATAQLTRNSIIDRIDALDEELACLTTASADCLDGPASSAAT
jgi:hypothetical protein